MGDRARNHVDAYGVARDEKGSREPPEGLVELFRRTSSGLWPFPGRPVGPMASIINRTDELPTLDEVRLDDLTKDRDKWAGYDPLEFTSGDPDDPDAPIREDLAQIRERFTGIVTYGGPGGAGTHPRAGPPEPTCGSSWS